VDDIEPLEPATWFRAIARLERWRVRSTEDELDRLLRHTFHLIQLAPRPLRSIIRSDLSEARLEMLLECQAQESAAMGLVGQPMRYGLARLTTGHFEAKVWFRESAEPKKAHSTSLASALLGAWTESIVSLEARAAQLDLNNPHPGLHRARYARRPPRFEH